MSEYLFLLPILIAFILGVMSPGPSFLVVARTAMADSRKKALYMSVGMGLGAMIFALMAASGLYLVMETMPWLFMALKLIGGAYLCFLAYKIFKSASNNDSVSEKIDIDKNSSFFKAFSLGLFTQLSNPKTAIVIAGIFAAFFPKDVPQYTYVLVCIMAFVIDSIWYSIVALSFSTSKAQRAYAKYQNYITYATGTLMGLIGLKLASSF